MCLAINFLILSEPLAFGLTTSNNNVLNKSINGLNTALLVYEKKLQINTDFFFV